MQPQIRPRRSKFLAAVLVAGLALSALPLALAADGSGSATVTNATPSIASLALYTSDPSASVTGTTCPAGTTTVTPNAASTRTVYICAVVSDDNGWQDVCNTSSAADTQKFSAYKPDGVTALADNYARSNIDLTCGTGSGASVTLTGSFVMEYWRPTAGTEANVSAGYLVTVDVTDTASAAATQATQRFYYSAIKSIGSIAAINYGTLAPGATSTQSVSVANQGNAAFALDVTGAALTGARGTIAASQVNWGADSTAAGGSLSTSAQTTLASIAAATSDTGSSSSLYLKLNVPSGSSQFIPAEGYSATYVFTAS